MPIKPMDLGGKSDKYNPETAKAKYEEASKLFAEGNHYDALTIMRKVDEAIPDQPNVLFALAQLRWKVKQRDEARNLADRLMDEFKDDRGKKFLEQVEQEQRKLEGEHEPLPVLAEEKVAAKSEEAAADKAPASAKDSGGNAMRYFLMAPVSAICGIGLAAVLNLVLGLPVAGAGGVAFILAYLIHTQVFKCRLT